MKSAKVSIVVPIYNVQDYIKECLDSLINQSLKDIEIICVDNCSQDNSVNIIQGEYLKDSRIIIIKNEKNMGMPFSRNTGLKNAHGKYVAFVDADDLCEITMFEKLYKMAEKLNADITTCSVYRFGGNVENKELHRNLDWYKEVKEAVPITERPQQLLEPAGWCKLFNRKFIESIDFKFTEGSLSCEDVPCITKAFLAASRIAFVHEALYYYRFRESGNLTASMGRKHIDDYLWAMDKQKEIMREYELSDEITISYIIEFKYLMAFFILSKIRHKDLRYYFKNIIKVFSKEEFQYLRRLFEYNPKMGYVYRIVVGQHRYLYITYKLLRYLHSLKYRVFHIEKWEIYKTIYLFGFKVKVIDIKSAETVYSRQASTIHELTDGWNSANKKNGLLNNQVINQNSEILELKESLGKRNKELSRITIILEEKESYISDIVESLAKKDKYISTLSYSLNQKKDFYKDVWCTGFIDSWKDYYNTNYYEIEKKKRILFSNLDEKSIRISELIIERNIGILPRQKYTNYFLYNHTKLYEKWELEGAKKEVEINGKYKVPYDVLVENAVFEFNNGLFFLPEEVLNQIRGFDVIDGGAYWGDSALVIDEYNPKSIICFEPSSNNYRKLKWTINNNITNSIVIAENKGLGNKNTKKKLYIPSINSGANLKEISPIYNEDETFAQEDISIITIDQYVIENGLNVGLIKLDIEGYEFEAIEGAIKTISLHKPILLISIYHNAKDFFEIKPKIEELELGYKFMIRKLVYHDLVSEVMLIGYCDKSYK